MSMNDNDAPIDKKKPGCFAIVGLFIIAWILVCFCWAIIQTVSKTQHLPMHTADFVQLHVEEKTNHAQKSDQRLDFLEPSYLRRKENHLLFSYCFGGLLGESALLCPPFIGQVIMGMALMQERRGEGVMMGLDMKEREKRAVWFGIIDVLGATFLIALPAFLIQRTITKKIHNKYSQKEIFPENEELEDIIINDNKPKTHSDPFDVMIEILRKGNNPWAQDISTQIAYNVMLETVLKITQRDKKEIIAMFSNDGIYQQGKEMLMLSAVLNKITWDVIATGRYHLYRGILNDTGKHLERLFYSTMEHLQNEGVLDDETAETWIQVLREDIAQVG